MSAPTRIHLYDRDGWVVFTEGTPTKGIFAYYDEGITKAGKPFRKVWFCDVFKAKGTLNDGVNGAKDNILINKIHASQRAFNKIGVNPEQLPLLIQLATMMYEEISGRRVAAPVLPDPLKRPDEIDALLSKIGI